MLRHAKSSPLESLMHRRRFLASVPVAAVAAPLLASGVDSAQGAGATPSSGQTAGPQAWAPGEERFIRNDVHSGDRVTGASFASRTAVYGTSGAAGNAHPLAAQTGIQLFKRGRAAVDAAAAMNACLGFLEPTSSGI